MAIESHSIQRAFGILILIGIVGWSAYTFLKKKQEDVTITYSTSDAKNLKGQISIALDSWIGYFPFRSPVFYKMMRDSGYRVKVIDDKANYAERMKLLRKGKIDFATATIDSYLLNGQSYKYPGIIISVIDESKGGDAIISRMRKVANIEQLKRAQNIKIAYTPGSPSEHLLKSIATHFDIPMLRNKEGSWKVEVDGAGEAYKKLVSGDVDVAVLWEPHVSEALFKPGYKKLIGSEDLDKLIVDILLVNRAFANKKPDLVKLFLKNYFATLTIYQTDKRQLKKDLQSTMQLQPKQIASMLKGVQWVPYNLNLHWFGIISQSSIKQPELIQSVNSAIQILLNNKDFQANPLQDKDPYTIINSSYLKQMYSSSTYKTVSTKTLKSSLTKRFKKLSKWQWNKLKVIGSLRLRPISFRTGTSKIDDQGRKEIKNIIDHIKHYPNFRILIKGHTGLRGDPLANKKLSVKRAAAVKSELAFSYFIDKNRIMIKGMGSSQPLPKNMDESDRSYNNRLKRVEIQLLSNK